MERQFIEWLAANLPPSPHLRLAIGDDAAVLPWAHGRDLVVTTDAVTDQVDFILAEVDPQLVGRKALGVNLSDLAAMAAEPVRCENRRGGLANGEGAPITTLLTEGN